jgi:GTPase SAR1 family protein
MNFIQSSRTSKLYLVGDKESGKSSLFYGLRREAPPKTILRTRGIEIGDLRVGRLLADQSRATFRVHDFGGHQEFRVIQSMFVNIEESIFFVVFKLRAKSDALRPTNEIVSEVTNWIQYLLTLGKPENGERLCLLLVGTHWSARQQEACSALYKSVHTAISASFRSSIHILGADSEFLVDLPAGRAIDDMSAVVLESVRSILFQKWMDLSAPSNALNYASPIRTILRSIDFGSTPLISCNELCRLIHATALKKDSEYGPKYAPDPSKHAKPNIMGYYDDSVEELPDNQVHPAYKAVFESMHQASELFYAGELAPESFVIVDMTWFCSNVLGGLFASNGLLFEERGLSGDLKNRWKAFYEAAKEGPVPTDSIAQLSDKASNAKLLPLVQEMGVCYKFVKVSKPPKQNLLPESDPTITILSHQPATSCGPAYMFPSLLTRNMSSFEEFVALPLFSQFAERSQHHIAVRISPRDSLNTQIPLGFFSNLQVLLRSRIGPDCLRPADDSFDQQLIPMYQNLAYVELDDCNVSALVFLEESHEQSCSDDQSSADSSKSANFDGDCFPKAMFVHVRGELQRGTECRELLAAVLETCVDVSRGYPGLQLKMKVCSPTEACKSLTPESSFKTVGDFVRCLQSPDQTTTRAASVASFVGLQDDGTQSDCNSTSFIKKPF